MIVCIKVKSFVWNSNILWCLLLFRILFVVIWWIMICLMSFRIKSWCSWMIRIFFLLFWSCCVCLLMSMGFWIWRFGKLFWRFLVLLIILCLWMCLRNGWLICLKRCFRVICKLFTKLIGNLLAILVRSAVKILCFLVVWVLLKKLWKENLCVWCILLWLVVILWMVWLRFIVNFLRRVCF